MHRRSCIAPGERPVWGCLDGREIRAAATGRSQDPAIEEHLSDCQECRRAVEDLARELRRAPGRFERRGGAAATQSRRWLMLACLALVGGGIWMLVRRPLQEPAALTAGPAAVVAPVPAAPAREAPPRPSRRPHARPGRAPLDRDIFATVRENQSGVRSCYERALKRDHRLAPRLEVQVSVLPTGAVERVAVGGALGAPELTSCIRSVIKGWKFPHAPQAYSTAFPLRLQQGG
jgi:hypothetical protein